MSIYTLIQRVLHGSGSLRSLWLQVCDYLMTVGMISAVKRMQREAVAWEANRPSTEKIVMAVSLRSKGHKDG